MSGMFDSDAASSCRPGRAGALRLFLRRRRSVKAMPEPPTPTFQEWVAAIEESATEPPANADIATANMSVPFAVADGKQ